MRRATIMAVLAALCLALAALLPSLAAAAAKPAWTLTATPMPSNFAPGSISRYLLVATNVGAASTTGEAAVIESTLPAGLKPLEIRGEVHDFEAIEDELACSILAQT